MGDLLKFAFSVYLISLSFSAFTGALRFFADVRKFKDKEEKFQTKKEFEESIKEAAEDEAEESEVNVNAVNDGEHNTPIIF